MRSYGLEGVVDDIRAAGGEIYAITSEPQRLASEARREWELAFETVGDPHHEISATCQDRGWLSLVVNTKTEGIISAAGEGFGHPKGYFQPGVLALTADGRVLYRWRSIPTRKSLGGAIKRPTARHVFNGLSHALASPKDSGENADAPLDSNPRLDSPGIPWALFMALLVANGWFLGPRPLTSISEDPDGQRRVGIAFLRLLVFIAAWVIALTQLPVWAVGLAFLGWVAWITPRIRSLNEEFQNLRDGT